MSDKADYEIEYSTAEARMDASKLPDNLEAGAFSRLVGIDGRYRGSLRKYPGHKYITGNANSGIASYVASAATFCQYVVMDMEGVQIRGFVFAKGTTLEFFYYNGSTWALVELDDAFSYAAGDTISVAVNGKFLYVFHDDNNNYPKVFYVESGWQKESLGPQTDGGEMAYTGQLAVPTYYATNNATSGGYLNFRGVYMVGVKYYHTIRQVYTGISVVLTLDRAAQASPPTTGNNHLYGITIHDYIGSVDDDHLPAGFDRIEIYRSLNLNNPLDAFHAGAMFLERTIDSAGQSNTNSAIGVLHDAALVQQKRYDPWADPIEAPPASGACMVMDGILFAARDPDDNSGIGITWTNPRSQHMEEFGSEFKYKGDAADGKVKKFIRTNSYGYAFTDTAIYRILVSGGDVAIGRIHKGISIAGTETVVALDDDLLMMTQQGLMRMDAGGNFDLVEEFDRVFFQEWVGDLDLVQMGYDSMMGCVYILLPSEQVLCYWTKDRRISLLEGIGWPACTSGPDVLHVDEGERAYFITEVMKISTPNYDGSGDADRYGTMSGEISGDDSTVGAGGITGLDNGRMVYMYDGARAGEFLYYSGTISAAAVTQGSTYSLDPVAMRMRFAPIREVSELSYFGRKMLKSLSVKCSEVTNNVGDSNGNTDIIMGYYRNGAGKASESMAASDTKTATVNPADLVVTFKGDGITIEPSIEHVSGAVIVEIAAIKCTGSYTESKKVTT